MSRASDSANAVVYAAEQVCALYGVQVTREQSRMFNVQGTAGRWRPMFVGQWTDDFGKIHRAGKADLLARPKINLSRTIGTKPPTAADPAGIIGVILSVPLWIECKSGAGKMKPDQVAFQHWVQKNGDTYLLIHDDVTPLIDWFKAHGVERHCDDAALRSVIDPIDSKQVNSLPCRWCKKMRDEHLGVALACSPISRKVWSPNLKAERP